MTGAPLFRVKIKFNGCKFPQATPTRLSDMLVYTYRHGGVIKCYWHGKSEELA